MDEVRRAGEADAEAMTAVLTRAFENEPFIRWLVLPSRGEAARRALFRVFVRALSLPHGEVYTTSATDGVALWVPPGKWRLHLAKKIRHAPAILGAVGLASAPRVWRGLDAIEAVHPEAPHHYLLSLGVEPSRQGQGVGSALMRPVLAQCDAERVGAYLETATQRNVLLYRRHGFEVCRELTLPAAGPTLWCMWRPPRP